MLLIDATNVGGGACVLLTYLAKNLRARKVSHFILCSQRVDLSGSPHFSVRNTPPFSIKRQLLLREYCKKLSPSHLFCFGNVPPMRRPKVERVSTYFHNALLVGDLEPDGLETLFSARLWLLRQSIAAFKENTDSWIFQTDYIANRFLRWYGVKPDSSKVIPFFEVGQFVESEQLSYDFVYSSSLTPHKNHCNLLKAIEICAINGFRPKIALTITVNRKSKCNSIIERCKSIGANICCTGEVDHARSLNLTAQSKFVVFPSLLETLGLGLIEAALLGKPVLCSDLPWVDEVIQPSISFDPYSPSSIAESMLSAYESSFLQPALLRVQDKVEVLIDWLSRSR